MFSQLQIDTRETQVIAARHAANKNIGGVDSGDNDDGQPVIVRGIPRQARSGKQPKPQRLEILGQLQYDR